MVTMQLPHHAHPNAHGDMRGIPAWTDFIRTQDAFYHQLARQQGQTYAPITEEELAVAAAIGAAFGVKPLGAHRAAQHTERPRLAQAWRARRCAGMKRPRACSHEAGAHRRRAAEEAGRW